MMSILYRLLLVLVLFFLFFQCKDASDKEDDLNKDLLLSHQEFIQDQEVLKGEHQDWEKALKQWKAQVDTIKQLSNPLFVEHKISLEAHSTTLARHDSLIIAHQSYLKQQNTIHEQYAMGKLSDEELQTKHEEILKQHNVILEKHKHIREVHQFIKDAHQAFLSALK